MLDIYSHVYQVWLKLLQAVQSHAEAYIHTYIHLYIYMPAYETYAGDVKAKLFFTKWVHQMWDILFIESDYRVLKYFKMFGFQMLIQYLPMQIFTSREYGRRNPLCWPRNTLYPQKLTLTSPAIGGRSVGIVRSRTKATEFFCLFVWYSQNTLKCPLGPSFTYAK
jgi:hypothetical protein